MILQAALMSPERLFYLICKNSFSAFFFFFARKRRKNSMKTAISHNKKAALLLTEWLFYAIL